MNDVVVEETVRAYVESMPARHPAVGLAVGVVRRGSLDHCFRHGWADIASRTPVDAGTVFRVASVTKPFTAIAVMQLHDRGLIDLDAAAGDYLRAYRLIPAPGAAPPTVRHLLTHTAGIPEVRHVTDLMHLRAGPFGSRPPTRSVPFGKPLPSLAEHFRHGLRAVVAPGTVFAYSNDGYATLGQIVEDVSGLPLERYFREKILDPLGMDRTGLVRTGRIATGYTVTRHGVRPVPDRDWIGAGGCGLYSTVADLARFAADLGRSLLRAETSSAMVAPQFRPDPRIPGWGLGFARGRIGGHRIVKHDGILPGFNSTLLAAPDDDLAVVALTNGSPGASMWMQAEFTGLLRRLLGAPADAVRTGIPHRPEVWGELCGTYRLPARISDLRGRLAIPLGVEVAVRGGRPVVRMPVPVPALRRGLPLHPDDPDDPYAFRLDLSGSGLGTIPVVFGRDPGGGAAAVHVDLGGQPLTLTRTRRR